MLGALLAGGSDAATARIYHIGNSLTDQVRYDQFKAAAIARGHNHIYGRHMMPGAPLNWMWEQAREGGFNVEPYGLYPNALSNYDWDFLVLQPFVQSYDAELQAVNDFYNYALKRNPNITICIHMAWPGTNDPKFYDAAWEDTASHLSQTRSYFERIIDAAQAAHPLQNPIRAVPMGEVMLELNHRILAGQVPGLTSINQLYTDNIHLNDIGSYLVMATHYAVIYQDDPAGLQTNGFSITTDQATAIQRAIRDVVLRYQRTRVTSLGPYPVTGIEVTPPACELNTGRAATLAAVLRPANATNRSISWSSTNTSCATVDGSGRVSASAAGTALIIAQSTDGGFRDTCAVTVLSAGTPVDGVVLSPDTLRVLRGTTGSFSATVQPSSASNQTLLWLSLDPSVATVSSSGVVTAVAKGQTAVVAVAVNGLKADTAIVRVTVPNRAPVAAINANSVSAVAPVTIRFSARGSYDPDSATGDFILGYDWDYGDGSLVEYWASPQHTFANPGTYHVRLRVLDDNDTRSGWDTAIVTVRAPDASLFAYEPFEYADGALQRCHGGQGFSQQWEVQNQDTIQPGFCVKNSALATYPGLSQRGGYSQGGRAYLGCGRTLNTANTTLYPNVTSAGKLGTAGATIWFSGLVRKEQANDQRAAFSLTGGGSNTVGLGYFGTSSEAGGKRYWSLDLGGTVYRSPVEATVGQTALLVAKVTFASASTSVDFFVNPASLGATAPAGAQVSQVWATAMQFTTLEFAAGNSSGNSTIDELRIGPSYASVTPAGTVATASSALKVASTTRTPWVRASSSAIRVTCASPSTVEVVAADGRTVARVRNIRDWSARLRPGMYLVRVSTPAISTVDQVLIP